MCSALADFVSVDLLEHDQGADPTGPLILPVSLRRLTHRSRTAGNPESVTDLGEVVVYPAAAPQADSLIAGHSVVASVPSGDLDPWLAVDEAHARQVREFGVHSILSSPSGPPRCHPRRRGLHPLPASRPFTHDAYCWPEIAARAAVCIDNARRYSRERETTLTLQRSLLPRGLPGPRRWTPPPGICRPRTGVGGDWFDVIPLCRDAGGHGGGGRRRPRHPGVGDDGPAASAVRTLADIDLPRRNCSPTSTTWSCTTTPSRARRRPRRGRCDLPVRGVRPGVTALHLSRAGHPPPGPGPTDGWSAYWTCRPGLRSAWAGCP
ncbi:SpoIIE family protein phosphatase [Streptomyces hirsutus]